MFDEKRNDKKLVSCYIFVELLCKHITQNYRLEDIGTLDSFKAVYDQSLQRPDEQLCRLLYAVMKAAMRSHSRRPSSSEVCDA